MDEGLKELSKDVPVTEKVEFLDKIESKFDYDSLFYLSVTLCTIVICLVIVIIVIIVLRRNNTVSPDYQARCEAAMKKLNKKKLDKARRKKRNDV